MRLRLCLLLVIGFVLVGLSDLNAKDKEGEVYKSENLVIERISEHIYQHISYLNTQDFGKVPCNGMIVLDGNDAVVFDTPTNVETSKELIDWIENVLNVKITAVISTHFHADCLGGLKEFHKLNIRSYAHMRTVELANKGGLETPQNKFSERLKLPVGSTKVYAEFLGEGHTKDNIIGYFPDENIMFGGCLVKEIGAGKGNLEDANVKEWSATIEKVKLKYPQTKVVIPGHGKLGGKELLDYTISLFN